MEAASFLQILKPAESCLKSSSPHPPTPLLARTALLYSSKPQKCHLPWEAFQEYPQSMSSSPPLYGTYLTELCVCVCVSCFIFEFLEDRFFFFLSVSLTFIWQLNLAREPLRDGDLAQWLPEFPVSSWSFKTALSPQDEFSGHLVRRVNGSFPDLNMQTEILLSG